MRLLVPRPGRSHDRGEVGNRWPETQGFSGRRWIGNQKRRIAAATGLDDQRELSAGCPFNGRDHLTHRMTRTGAKVEATADRSVQQRLDRQDMRSRQILDMNI